MTSAYKLLTSFCLVCSLVSLAQAQKLKPTKNKAKKPLIKAVVTVKGNSGPIAPDPEEIDEGIWNKFEVEDAGISVLLPAKSDRISDDTVGVVKSYQAFTKRATYLIVTRHVGEPVNSQDVSGILEELMVRILDNNLISEKHDIKYGNYSGKQFVFIDRGKRSINRVFLVNGHIVALSVTIKVRDYDSGWTKWIDKYFESLTFTSRAAVQES